MVENLNVLFSGGPLDGTLDRVDDDQFPVLFPEGHYDLVMPEVDPEDLLIQPGQPFPVVHEDDIDASGIWVPHSSEEYVQLIADRQVLARASEEVCRLRQS